MSASPENPFVERRIQAAPASLESLLGELPDDDEDIFGNRVEWKFVLDPAVAAAVREEVAARLRLEEFIPGRKKTIMHSVYFDSADFMLYRRAAMTESSLKFRLRTYTTFGDWSKMDPQGFFECKIGQKGKKFKLRSMLPVVRAGDLMVPAKPVPAGTGRLGMPGVPSTGRLTIAADSRFMWKARRVLGEFQMTARLTVSYVREAWVSENGALRITFDEHYRAAPIQPGGITPLSGSPGTLDQVIAEVKFVGAVPDWLAAVLQAHGMPLGGITFSKFRHGVALSYPEVPVPPEFDRALHVLMPGVSLPILVAALCSALVLSGLMAFVYRRAAGEHYDADVAQAQILLACIMALVLMVVGESVARAFGAVGILSVIRFRSNVGTASEAATLLGSVAVGMACGAGLFGVALAGTLFLCFVQVLLRRVFGAPEGKKGKNKQQGGKKDKKKKDKKGEAEAEAVVPAADDTQVVAGS